MDKAMKNTVEQLRQAGNQYAAAEIVVDRKLSFYKHLTMFILLNTILLTINLLTTPHYWWAQWPLLGWGVGIACHGMQVFFLIHGASLHQSMLARELENQKK